MVFSTESRCLIDKATTQERRETKPSATKQHFGCTNSKYNSCACYARAFPCCYVYYIVIIYFWPFMSKQQKEMIKINGFQRTSARKGGSLSSYRDFRHISFNFGLPPLINSFACGFSLLPDKYNVKQARALSKKSLINTI